MGTTSKKALVRFRSDGTIMSSNKLFLEMAGLDDQQIVGSSMREIINEESYQALRECLQGCTLTGDPGSVSLVISDPTGDRRLLSATVAKVSMNDEEQVFIALVESSEENEAEISELSRELDFHRAVMSQSAERIFVHDLEGKIIAVSDAACKSLGYVREELLRRKIFDVDQRFGVDSAKAFWEELRKTGYVTFESIHKRKDGVVFPVEITLGTITHLNKELVVATARDISSRKAAETEADALRERFKAIFDHANDAIFLMDREVIIDCNRKTEEIFVCKKADIVGMKPFEISPPEQPGGASSEKEARRLIEKAIEGKRRIFEWRHRRLNGQDFAAEISLSPIQLRGKNLLLAIVRDITDRKKAETTLKESFDSLVETMSMMIELKDPYTRGHQEGVTRIATALAQKMGLSSERMEGLRIASLLHDVGKTSIPTEILSKPSQLSALEMDLVRKHPEIGFDILSQVEFPWPVAEIVRQHHEKINGSGYPRGLKGHEMLPEARILVVADVVEAMSSHRPYRQALGINEAIDEIVTNSGILYDDRVVKTCVNLIKERPDLLS